MTDERTGAALAARPSLEAREAAVARLSAAFAHEVLSLDEFERRTTDAYRAASGTELAALVADLPATVGTNGPSGALPEMPARVAAAFSNVERGGAAVVPPRLEIRAVFGNVELDLGTARFGDGVTEISIQAVFGNVRILLPPGVRVQNHGAATLGSFVSRCTSGGAASNAQVLVTGRALFANVELTDDPRSVGDREAHRALQP